ncbi:MAG: DUF4384 domain-containing protein, partial [Gemmatimonadota bacterium]
MRAVIATSLALAAANTVSADGGAAHVTAPQEYPQIAVRITERDYFQRYERVSVTVESSTDAYLTVFRVDTDGRIRVIYPRDPRDNNFVAAGHSYRIPNPYGQRGEHAFVVDDYPGVGYVFVVASHDPFNYQPYVRNDHWEWRNVAHDGRITGDPYVGFVEVVEPMLPLEDAVWSFDVVPYFVEKQHPYPRFLCYECHTYLPHPVWDTYGDGCPRFRILVFEDAIRYPTMIYPSTRVVGPTSTVRPRYVIQPRSQAEPFVTRVRREDEPSGRRAPERGVRGTDVGGVGTVPAPVRAPTRRVTSEESNETRRQPSSGGVGGFLRRLFGGGDDDKDRREPTVQREGDEQGKQVRPKLERRERTGGVNPTTKRKPEQPTRPTTRT